MSWKGILRRGRRGDLRHPDVGRAPSDTAPDGTPQEVVFRDYRPEASLGSVKIVTPATGYFVHTFFDVCPFSPSERFLAVTALPYQGRKPRWGDAADVCVIDLEERSLRRVYRTRAWSFQLGANVQWGARSDRFLYTNDIVDGEVFGVRIALDDLGVTTFAGPKYDIAPDEGAIAGPNLLYMNTHQYGYSVPDPPSGKPLRYAKRQMSSEGIWQTALETNTRNLLVPYSAFRDASSEKKLLRKGVLYGFHTKYNRDGTRLMQVVRCQIGGRGKNPSLFTFGADGSDLVECIPPRRWREKARLGGSSNHPNWHPDGEHLVINSVPRWLGQEDMRFCMLRYDGSDFRVLTEKFIGSGHPSIDPTSRYILTDAYPSQEYALAPNGELPIRLIDLRSESERTLATVSADLGQDRGQTKEGSHWKLDPHPVWGRSYRKVCFNAVVEGRRQVLVADLDGVL